MDRGISGVGFLAGRTFRSAPPWWRSAPAWRDWEANTVIGKGRRGELVTMVERNTLFMLAHLIRSRTKGETSDALLLLLSPLSE